MTLVQEMHAVARSLPMDADRLFNLGIYALKSGEEVAGLPIIAAAARRIGSDPRLWQIEALMHRALDDLTPAVSAFKKAAMLAPADARIAHGLARATLEAGLAAADLFRVAHRLAPNDGDILLGLAAAEMAEGGPEKASEELDRQLERHPGWLPGHASLARLRWMGGDRETFTSSLDRALQSNPRDPALWRELVMTFINGNQYGRAMSAIKRARVAIGDQPFLAANEAVCVAETGNFEEAERLFDTLPEADITITVRRIRNLLRAGRPDQAGTIAEPVTRRPEANVVWPYLSVIWRLLGDSRWEWLEGDPRFTGVLDLADKIPSIDALAKCLRRLHVAKQQPLEQSVRGGTQTDGELFKRIEPEIRALREVIVEAVRVHAAQLPRRQEGHPLLGPPRSDRVRFAGSWSVRLVSAGFHANHIHPAGWLSSALYVALPSQEVRGEPPAGWLTLGEPQAELGVNLPPFRTIEPRIGRLVLFPSTMWHGTRPFAEGERLTVAFDVAPGR